MDKDYYLLVNTKILPPVFKNVVRAKKMLADGTAPNAMQAAKLAGISRSAFYKYKDFVFKYDADDENTVTLNALLSDRAGVFSAMTARLYEHGANIITVNQNKPVDSIAAVSLTVETENINISLEELLQDLSSVDGIISVKSA